MNNSQNEHLPWSCLVIVLTLLCSDSLPVAGEGLGTTKCLGMSRGMEFTIGFTENLKFNPENRHVFVLVVGLGQEDTEVNVSSISRDQPNQHVLQPLHHHDIIQPNTHKKIPIPVEYMMIGTEKRFKGIKVSASHDVEVYGVSSQTYSADGFLGISDNSLGMQYVVVTFEGSEGNPSQFAVIGTHDATQVRVTFRTTRPITIQGQKYDQGDTFNFTLNELEAFQIQTTRGGILTGTLIQSSKPVAVFTGNTGVNTTNSALDTLTEQLVPVESWGKNHIYTAFRESDSNVYTIVAYFDNTKVSIPGFSDQILDSGEFWEGKLDGSGHVSSSKPTLMMQLLTSSNGDKKVDPSLIHIPSEEQFRESFGFVTPPPTHRLYEQSNFVTIVTDKEAADAIRLYGSPLEIDDSEKVITDIPNTQYVAVSIKLPKGEGVFFAEQPTAKMSAIVYGYGERESYGYAAGLSLPRDDTILSFSSFYFREVGGEILDITVPCLPFENDIEWKNAQCKFETGIGGVSTPGNRMTRTTVRCETPFFYQSGLTQVSVSVDDGNTFPNSGNIYVASQDDYPPLLNVEQVNWDEHGKIIDIHGNDSILFSWDPNSVGRNSSKVTLVVERLRNHNGVAVSTGKRITTIIKNGIANSGQDEILPNQLKQRIKDNRADADDETPLLVFSLIPSEDVGIRIRSGVLIVSLFLSCGDYTRELKADIQDAPPCPCNVAQAGEDFNFELSNELLSFFHPSAQTCFRSTTSSAGGSGQNCCYGDDGNILVGSHGGGTPDRYSPVDNFWLHQTYDVIPWFACCTKQTQQCKNFYSYRPSDDCSRYNPPRPIMGFGEPHIVSLDGREFTFNGAGEFLMMSSEMNKLTFQARMEVFNDTEATVFTALVLQTNDSAKVQVEVSNEARILIIINGKPLRPESGPVKTHFDGVQVIATEDFNEVRVVFQAGLALTVYKQFEALSFIAQLHAKFRGRIEGLLGNFNSNPEDDFQLPNGTILNDSRSLQAIHKFGLNWRVSEADSIFTYLSPYNHSSFDFPDFIPSFHNPDSNVSTGIQDLCGDSFACIFDAITTGSLLFANETLRIKTDFEAIRKSLIKIVSCGFPGLVDNGTLSGNVYLVNSSLTVTCHPGYILEGSSELFCNNDGHWSSTLPRCIDGPNNQGTSVAAIVLGVVGFVAALGIVGILWFIITKKNKDNSCFH